MSSSTTIRFVVRFVTFLVLTLFVAAITPTFLVAQDNYDQAAKSKSPLKRLGEFHEKMKQKFSPFRKNRNDSNEANWNDDLDYLQDRNQAPEWQEYPNASIQQAQYQQSLDRDRISRSRQPTRGTPPQYYTEPQRSNYGSQPPYGSNSQSRMQPNSRSLRDSAPPVPEGNLYNNQPVVDHQTRPEPIGTYENIHPHSQHPVSNSIYGENWNPAAVQANYSGGHFDHGSGIQPQGANRTQVTATQRALILEKENDRLRSAKAALNAENQRLQRVLSENRKLLADIEAAIESANQELANANQHNEELQNKIVKLEAAQKAQQLETARLLDSIRNNLDDVLMREMTRK